MPYGRPLQGFCTIGLYHALRTGPCRVLFVLPDVRVLLFPFYREEVKSQRNNLSKITLLDSDNFGI